MKLIVKTKSWMTPYTFYYISDINHVKMKNIEEDWQMIFEDNDKSKRKAKVEWPGLSI